MYDSPSELTGNFFKPLMDIWGERIRAAQNAKMRFDTVGKTCNDFYESQRGFMWKNQEYFSGKIPEPKFKVVVAKAFEFVSIYGPHLFWQYADRAVTSQRQLKLTPEIFGDISNPQVQQLAQQVMGQEAQEQAVQNFINKMMSTYLNWSQREQPGTLMVHGMMATIESLIKGVGLLWPETYQNPGSSAVYTKLTYDTVDNLLIDADCKDPTWESAGYIMVRHITPIWEIERKFGLARGSLEGKANHASAELNARINGNQASKDNKTFDCLEWYEIWSKVGVGPRTAKLNHHMIDMFDETVGDFAYICMAPNVEYPLNASPDRFFGDDAADEEKVAELFQWRCRGYGDAFPCYGDNRWPVSPMIYNPVLGSPWPLAPLAPGLGELISINILTTAYLDMAWENRKQIIAYHASAATELEDALNSDKALTQVKLNDNIHEQIQNVLQFVQRPNTQSDILTALEMQYEAFNRRVGLNELQYGESKTQIRVASDSRQKQEALSIRPEKMSGDVARCYTNASQLEMFLAAMHVQGKDLTHLLGGYGAMQWDMAFASLPIEQLMREMTATVEASEVRRPNKERDTANIQSLQQFALPMLQSYATDTSNTEPLNKFLALMHEAMDMRDDPIQLPPWSPPPPDEKQQQMAEAAQMAELKKTIAEAQNKEAGAQKSQVDAAAKMVEVQMPGGMIGELKHDQEMRHKEQTHAQGLMHNEQTQFQQLLFGDLEGEQQLEQKREQAKVKAKPAT